MTVSHTVEVRTGPIDEQLTPEQLEAFADAILEDKTIAGPAVLHDQLVNALEVRATVDGPRTLQAITTVTNAIQRALQASKITATQGRIDAWPDIEGVEWPDELVNGGEVARRLGISRERMRQLIAARPTRFPAAVAQTARDRIWRWGDVAEWAAVLQRKAKSPRRRPATMAGQKILARKSA